MARGGPALEWRGLIADASRLWADVGMVMALRSLRIMAGGAAAERELATIVGEKIDAALEMSGALASGRVNSPEAAARKALAVYGKRVRANLERLR